MAWAYSLTAPSTSTPSVMRTGRIGMSAISAGRGSDGDRSASTGFGAVASVEAWPAGTRRATKPAGLMLTPPTSISTRSLTDTASSSSGEEDARRRRRCRCADRRVVGEGADDDRRATPRE